MAQPQDHRSASSGVNSAIRRGAPGSLGHRQQSGRGPPAVAQPLSLGLGWLLRALGAICLVSFLKCRYDLGLGIVLVPTGLPQAGCGEASSHWSPLRLPALQTVQVVVGAFLLLELIRDGRGRPSVPDGTKCPLRLWSFSICASGELYPSLSLRPEMTPHPVLPSPVWIVGGFLSGMGSASSCLISDTISGPRSPQNLCPGCRVQHGSGFDKKSGACLSLPTRRTGQDAPLAASVSSPRDEDSVQGLRVPAGVT